MIDGSYVCEWALPGVARTGPSKNYNLRKAEEEER